MRKYPSKRIRTKAKQGKPNEKCTKQTEGELDEEEDRVNETYEEIVFWKQKNLFDPPKCEETKEMIRVMTKWIWEFVENKPMAEDALKWLMILPTILMQKQKRHSKVKDNIRCLKRRIKLLRENDIDKLLAETFELRRRHMRDSGGKNRSEDEAFLFSKLMQRGKVNPSLRIISKNGPKGTLDLNEDTREALKKLHPQAEEAYQKTKLQEL